MSEQEEATLLPIDKLFRVEVFSPWEEFCKESDRPWEATPELRAAWNAFLDRPDRLHQECGFLALSRCTNLTEDERGRLRDFWSAGKDFTEISSAAALRLLLSGGSPQELLFNLYLADLSPRDVAINPITKTLVSMLCRHPNLPHLAESLAGVTNALALGFAWCVNPSVSVSFIRPLVLHQNPWQRAAGLFNPVISLKEARDAAEPFYELDWVALALRPDLDHETHTYLENALKQIDHESNSWFDFIWAEHPAQRDLECPQSDWANPHRETIKFFSEQTYLGALWRWWNPLLTMPWLVDQLTDINEPGVLIAFQILGAPSEIMSNVDLKSIFLSRIEQVHPSILMERYFMEQAQNDI